MGGVWARRVTVAKHAHGDPFAHIQSTEEAAYYLLDHWKKGPSSMYCAAIRMCAKAIKGEVSHDGAYISFMAAVREAGVAIVSNPHYSQSDSFLLEVEKVVAESVLADMSLSQELGWSVV